MANSSEKFWLKAKKRSGRGVSPAISTVIVTAATVVLVLVASQYTYRIMEQNRGAAEFASAKKAMLKLNDSIWYVSDKPQTSRITQFAANYGEVMLMSKALNVTLTMKVGGNTASYSVLSGLIKYRISTNYVTYGDNYREIILGNDKLIVTRGTEDLGVIVVEQQSGWVNIVLSYRVYVAKTYETVSSGKNVTYVNVRIVKIEAPKDSIHVGELDIITKCVGRGTTVSYAFEVPSSGFTASVGVKINESLTDSWTSPPLKKGSVIFNVIVSVINISVYGGR